jgi:DNA replication licensing factor MCM5
MDAESVYTLSVLPAQTESLGEPRIEIQAKLKEFILVFQLDGAYIYRDQIRENILVKQYYCDVDIAHLISYNEELAHLLTSNPADIIPLFETALKQCTQRIVYPQDPSVQLPQHQLLLHSSIAHISIRDLNATNVSHLVRIPGIVIASSTPTTKATLVAIQCRNCGHPENMTVDGGIAGITLPRTCSRVKIPGQESGEQCPLDPYFVVHEKSQFIDQQIIKLQEAPDQVPVGELPRHIMISADRYLTNRVVPGSRCTIMGVFSIYQSQKSGSKGRDNAVAIRNPYLRCVGLTTDSSHLSSSDLSFTDAEIQEFEEMSRLPDLYNRFAKCIAPSIYGNADIKKAIACLLMGGSKKILPDGMKLRGDINVLLLGDPGTAKSQLLKFVEKVSPIAIYTSGKGSSAAGLTASVQRDTTTREFYLEGGAMVLADGGVVCIDEFDKMRDEDRVAIHEAMEQQTISIAKAGITTILNARTSVLAAANPIFGRYDDLKSPGENIDFQTTILSRFDMIFIVRDDHDRNRDETIARHVMNIHMGNRGTAEEQVDAEFDVEKMKRYITFCKSYVPPFPSFKVHR